MIEKKLIPFNEALKRDGTAGEVLDVVIDIANMIPLHATGSIVYTLNIELRNIQEYYSLDIELKFDKNLRNSRVIEARKITMDEYIGVHWKDDRELRETYFEMLKQFER